MRTYLILKEKAERFRHDSEIQSLLKEIHGSHTELESAMEGYSPDNARQIRQADLDRKELANRRLPYERLDQLTIDLLLGVR